MHKLVSRLTVRVHQHHRIASSFRTKVAPLGAQQLVRFACSGSKTPASTETSTSTTGELPEPPTDCCMSGCANCVWITYAETLMKHYKDGGTKARDELERLVTDPSLKMFLRLELNDKINEKGAP